MPVVATTFPNASPPYVQVSISSSTGAAITAVTLSRTVFGQTDTVRVQPAAGPSPRLINDYEIPWEAYATYNATVTSTAGVETFTSNGFTLTPTVAWMVHPTTPALSCQLDALNMGSAGVVSIGAVNRPATTTGHDIIGSKYRLITKSGPRGATRTQVTVATVTPLERDRLWAMVDDQTPILFRVPSAFGWSWEDGYYNVDDVTENRRSTYGAEARRDFTLSLERVLSPAGTQQAARTYADVLAGFATYNSVRGTYSTYTNLLTDTRA